MCVCVTTPHHKSVLSDLRDVTVIEVIPLPSVLVLRIGSVWLDNESIVTAIIH